VIGNHVAHTGRIFRGNPGLGGLDIGRVIAGIASRRFVPGLLESDEFRDDLCASETGSRLSKGKRRHGQDAYEEWDRSKLVHEHYLRG
jgi:hypothetical protein